MVRGFLVAQVFVRRGGSSVEALSWSAPCIYAEPLITHGPTREVFRSADIRLPRAFEWTIIPSCCSWFPDRRGQLPDENSFAMGKTRSRAIRVL
ncbi:hypothetical protein L218DRAFT_359030 [Marasmius fiardii PR-910]|nr:hypothetical protein L218DRAFT_359030 [Marasmius fiardii PR-910]